MIMYKDSHSSRQISSLGPRRRGDPQSSDYIPLGDESSRLGLGSPADRAVWRYLSIYGYSDRWMFLLQNIELFIQKHRYFWRKTSNFSSKNIDVFASKYRCFLPLPPFPTNCACPLL